MLESDIPTVSQWRSVSDGIHIDDMLARICSALTFASDHYVPNVRRTGTKPYWSKELIKRARKECERAPPEMEKTRDSGREQLWIWGIIQGGKGRVRRAIRRAEIEYERYSMAQIAEAEEMDQTFVRHLVNKTKGKGTSARRIHPTYSNDGSLIHHPPDIAKSWGE